MAQLEYTITHYYDVNGTTGTQDVSDNIISIPLFTDTGSGEINEAKILLDADNGNYIKDDSSGKRIIQQHDIIKLTVDDGLGTGGTQDGTYTKYFNVVKKIPIKSKSEGVRLLVELLGVEQWLQRVQYIKPSYFENAQEVFQDIGQFYNVNKGTGMPTLDGHLITDSTNKLPNNTENVYDFGNNEDNCFDRMGEVIDKVGASGDNGGVLDFYDLNFTYGNNGSDLTSNVFSSGSPSEGNEITLTGTTSVNVGESDGGINAEEGTLINSWGANDKGSLPVEHSRFMSRQQWWNLFFPNWKTGASYKSGAKTSIFQTGSGRVNFKVKSGQDHTASNSNKPPNSTYWEEVTSAAYYGNVYKYSPWTAQRAEEWKNTACDPSGSYGLTDGTASGKISMFDHNIISRDGTFFRTFVDQIATTQTIGTTFGRNILQQLLYDDNRDGSGTALYRGFRVLCKGEPYGSGPWFGYSNNISGTSASASTVVDGSGRLIKDSILEYTGTEWLVKYRPYENQFTTNTTPTQLQVNVIYEGRNYQFYADSSNQTWQNVADADNGNDAFHPVISSSHVANVPGCLSKKNTNNTVTDVDTLYGWDSTNTNSAIEVTYNWSPFDIWNLDRPTLIVENPRNTSDFYQCGAWLSFRFPFPTTTVVGTGTANGQLVGDWYGGGTNTSNPHEPTTLDSQNMHFTHDGKRGFNYGLSSEDYGQISGISFMSKLWFQRKPNTSGGSMEDVTGEDGSNFKMRCVLVDSHDNVVTQDFILPFNNHWFSITLPLSGFEVYRGRQPRYLASVNYNFIQPKALDVQDIFIWRDVKLMSIFTLDSYDEYGRYHPGGSAKWADESTLDVLTGLFKIGYSEKELRLAVDALHFVKPLLVNSGQVASQVVEPDFLQRPDIGNYEQLKSDVESERQIKKFQHVEFDTTTTGRFDIGFGDFYNFKDEDIVPDRIGSETFSNDTIKLVAKRIEYSITKPTDGKGGFLRRIRGVKRFV